VRGGGLCGASVLRPRGARPPPHPPPRAEPARSSPADRPAPCGGSSARPAARSRVMAGRACAWANRGRLDLRAAIQRERKPVPPCAPVRPPRHGGPQRAAGLLRRPAARSRVMAGRACAWANRGRLDLRAAIQRERKPVRPCAPVRRPRHGGPRRAAGLLRRPAARSRVMAGRACAWANRGRLDLRAAIQRERKPVRPCAPVRRPRHGAPEGPRTFCEDPPSRPSRIASVDQGRQPAAGCRSAAHCGRVAGLPARAGKGAPTHDAWPRGAVGGPGANGLRAPVRDRLLAGAALARSRGLNCTLREGAPHRVRPCPPPPPSRMPRSPARPLSGPRPNKGGCGRLQRRLAEGH
jgi:hypothetical protein